MGEYKFTKMLYVNICSNVSNTVTFYDSTPTFCMYMHMNLSAHMCKNNCEMLMSVCVDLEVWCQNIRPSRTKTARPFQMVKTAPPPPLD
jgi:hypothetical protein